MIPNLHELLHPKDFFAALWPYRISAMAFGHCNSASKKLRLIYTIVMTSASLLSLYLVGSDMYSLIVGDEISDVEAVISNLVFWSQIIIVPMHILTWFFVGHSCYMKVVASLTYLDKEIERICCKRVNLKTTVIRQLLCLFLQILFAIIFTASRMATDPMVMSRSYMSIIIRGHYCGLVDIVIMTFFGNLVCFVGDRYILINSVLEDIEINLKNESATDNQSKVIFDEVKLTGKLRVVHRELFFVSQKVMDAFAIQTFTCVLSSFTFTVYSLFMEYKIGISLPGKWIIVEILIFVFELVYNFGVITYVSYCCHGTVQKANGTTKILNSLRTESEDLRLEVSSFSYQLMHYQLHFSPLGFYQLDLALVQSMIGSIATYLVILIQMKPRVPSVRKSLENATVSEIM